MPEPDCILILTTLPADADLSSFAETLVDERLAACVAIHPAMESVYRWEGRLEHERECQVVIKTSAARREELLVRIGELHPYDLPELLVLRVDGGGEAYLRWIEEETK